MGETYNVEGLDKLEKYIAQMSHPEKVFDLDFKNAALRSERELKINTNKLTGQTAKAWVTRRKGDSYYTISNNVLTQDRKHAIVDILNDGRGEVRPVKAKALYIPISTKGRGKKLGAKIPKDFVYGIDYVFAQSSKEVMATKFVDKAIIKSETELIRAMLRTIDKL